VEDNHDEILNMLEIPRKESNFNLVHSRLKQ